MRAVTLCDTEKVKILVTSKDLIVFQKTAQQQLLHQQFFGNDFDYAVPVDSIQISIDPNSSIGPIRRFLLGLLNVRVL